MKNKFMISIINIPLLIIYLSCSNPSDIIIEKSSISKIEEYFNGKLRSTQFQYLFLQSYSFFCKLQISRPKLKLLLYPLGFRNARVVSGHYFVNIITNEKKVWMGLTKLKLDKFSRFSVHNFPGEFHPDLESVKKNIEVIMYYIDKIEDVADFVKLCENADLKIDNRIIMVYKKVRKDGINRDSIFSPFKNGKYKNFKMKTPMLCSLSENLSAFIQMKI